MKSIFGEVRQLGFVSDDIDRSIRHFLDYWNIGPWYVVRNIVTPTIYKGEPSDTEISLALSHCGELQFEIIQQHNETASAYRDALARSPGLHVQHIAVWADDVPTIKRSAMSLGWTPVLESPTDEACYLVHPSEPLVCVEVSDRSPSKEHVRKVVREMAENWDGTSPIREGLPR